MLWLERAQQTGRSGLQTHVKPLGSQVQLSLNSHSYRTRGAGVLLSSSPSQHST